MPDPIETAADAFHDAIDPDRAQPRDDQGRFESVAPPVDRLFENDTFEGEPGDDNAPPRARTPKKEKSDGREELPDGQQDDEEGVEEPDDKEGADDADEEADGDAGETGPHYEVTVDGEVKQVSLKEALEGYIRTETFHQRMNKVSEVSQVIQQEAAKNNQLRDHWIKRVNDLEGEFMKLLPKEPDWDAEFARDPGGAHSLKKQFDAVKGTLQEFRENRAREEQVVQQENARRVAEYAARGQQEFIKRNQLEDEGLRNREVAAMRKTALAEGFLEQEIATVFDPRMLTILRKASKYDRIMANRPKAVIPGRGKTLTPGSGNGATPRRTDRKGINDAQRKLATDGSLESASDFFRNFLR